MAVKVRLNGPPADWGDPAVEVIDSAMVDHGRAVIRSDADVRNLGPGARAEIVTADRENEGGDIDADLAGLVVRPPCSERSSMDDPTLRS